jgi:hypothetical protein
MGQNPTNALQQTALFAGVLDIARLLHPHPR